MTIREIQNEDLVVWPDGTTCYYYELEEYSFMSDDYEVVPQDTPRYLELTADNPNP